MTNTCSSPSCEYPTTADLFICKICVQALSRDLGDIPALIDDLHTTMSRQDRIGAAGGRRAAESSLPWKEPAAEALWVLTQVVVVWAREFDDQPVPDAPVVAARWLLVHVHDVATRPQAGQVVDEVAAAVKTAYEVIDRPPDLLLAGRCGAKLDEGGSCSEYLYARPDATHTACRACKAEHSVDERRAWMMQYASELQLPAVTALAWVKQLMGKSIPRGTWDGWVHKSGRISPTARVHVGVALYRFGDVRDLAAEWVARPRKDKAA